MMYHQLPIIVTVSAMISITFQRLKLVTTKILLVPSFFSFRSLFRPMLFIPRSHIWTVVAQYFLIPLWMFTSVFFTLTRQRTTPLIGFGSTVNKEDLTNNARTRTLNFFDIWMFVFSIIKTYTPFRTVFFICRSFSKWIVTPLTPSWIRNRNTFRHTLSIGYTNLFVNSCYLWRRTGKHAFNFNAPRM